MATDISNNSTIINVNSTDPALKIVQSGSGTPFKIQDSSDVRKNVCIRTAASPLPSLQTPNTNAQIAETQAEMNDIVAGSRIASPEAILSRWKTFDHSGGGQNRTRTINGLAGGQTYNNPAPPPNDLPIPARPFTQVGNLVSISTGNAAAGDFSILYFRSVRPGSVISVTFADAASSGLLRNVTGNYEVLENTNPGGTGNLVIRVTQNQNINAAAGARCSVTYHESDCWNIQGTDLTYLENSGFYVGFVSDIGYENYVFDVIVRSENGDDDSLGLVMAIDISNTGVESTLIVQRTLDDTTDDIPPAVRIVEGTTVSYDLGLAGSTHLFRQPANEPAGWSVVDSGSRIRVIRQGDQFTVDTTDVLNNGVNYFAGRTWAQIIAAGERQANFNVNLNNNANTLKFKGPKPYGVVAQSQSLSFFRVLNFTNINPIYDVGRNVMRTYNVATGNWNAEVAFNPVDVFGPEKYIHDPFTKKTYFIDRNTNTIRKMGGEHIFLDDKNRANNQIEISDRLGFVFEDAGGISSRIRVQNDSTFAINVV